MKTVVWNGGDNNNIRTMKKNYIIFLSLLIIIQLTSCTKESLHINNDLSLFAFVVADNNLDEYADYVERDLINGLKNCPIGTELLLYIDRQGLPPSLRQYVITESGKIGINTIEEYLEQCLLSEEVFSSVLNTMLSKSSGSRYGIIFWSHGSGWLPANNSGINKTKSIGEDDGYSMDIEDMARIITSKKEAYFTLLDACFMGGVEVAFAMRDATKYLIASPAEILGVGFPYSQIMPELAKGTELSLSNSLQKYLDFCNSDIYDDGVLSGIATMIDCTEMDSLASCFKNVVNKRNETVVIDSIQFFDYSYTHLYYDIGQYAKFVSCDSLTYELFMAQLERTVINKVHTQSLYTQVGGNDRLLPIKFFSGLSTYIPRNDNSYYDWSYSQTEWYKRCYESE